MIYAIIIGFYFLKLFLKHKNSFKKKRAQKIFIHKYICMYKNQKTIIVNNNLNNIEYPMLNKLIAIINIIIVVIVVVDINFSL